ncbi:hypothetical protein Tco_1194216 [Tanacetum coccineum]
MSSLKTKQPKEPPPKRTRNIGKSKRVVLTSSSSTESPPSDNGDLPSTKLSPRSYCRALKEDLNMSKEQRGIRGMFKYLGRASGSFYKNMRSTDPPYGRSVAPSKSISSKSTHYTSSSSPSESPTPTHVAPPPKLCFVIRLKLEPQELPPLASSQNDTYVLTMDNWPLGPSKPSPPPRFTQPPPGFPHPPPGFKPLPSTQPLFVNTNNNIPHLYNNTPPLENIHHPPPNLGN